MSHEVFDIFLSHASFDAGTASVVENALTASGLTVFRASDIRDGGKLAAPLLEALIESNAFVALLSPQSVISPNIAFELGMAMSWRKQIYLLLDRVNPNQLFAGAAHFRAFPLSSLAAAVAAIKQKEEPLTAADSIRLKRMYVQMRVPTDRLLTSPAALEELARRFQDLAGREITGERLAGELLRLRKRGQPPRLRQNRNHTESTKGAA